MATIQDIEKQLFARPCGYGQAEIHQLRQDERRGVQRLLTKWDKQQQQVADLREKYVRMSRYEQALYQKGVRYVAGVDEAGRGPLAGPVVAGAVILNSDVDILGLDDSKKLSKQKRQALYEQITREAVTYGTGIVSAKEIDELNIYQAARTAMARAVQALHSYADYLLVDAISVPLDRPQTAVVKGDQNSVSIAAGSIIAKVTRDRLMQTLDEQYPEYQFAQHAGYPTADHLERIRTYGVCPEHRRSFAPVGRIVSSE